MGQTMRHGARPVGNPAGRFAACRLITLLQQGENLLKRQATVKQQADPAGTVHMVSRQLAGAAAQQIPQQRIGTFEIRQVNPTFTRKAQGCARQIHDQCKPFAIVRPAQHKMVRAFGPQRSRGKIVGATAARRNVSRMAVVCVGISFGIAVATSLSFGICFSIRTDRALSRIQDAPGHCGRRRLGF